MWIGSVSLTDPDFPEQLNYILAHEWDLREGLSIPEQERLVQMVNSYATMAPFHMRSAFERFGAKRLKSSPATDYPAQVTQQMSAVQSGPTRSELLAAQAILEIRSIVMKHPKRRSALLPQSWSRRYGAELGPYAVFVQTYSPRIFHIDSDTPTGLITASLSDEFINEGYLGYQRLLDVHGKATARDEALTEEDTQYQTLCQITSESERASIAGGLNLLKQACDELRLATTRFPSGFSSTIARKSLTDKGILPLPLEWFDSVIAIPGPDRVYLRKAPIAVPHICGQNLAIEAFVGASSGKCVSVGALCGHVGVDKIALVGLIRQCPRIFFEPDMVYPCRYFQDTVEGYISPSELASANAAAVAASMSPIRHLLSSIESTLTHTPDRKLGTEYVLAWCAALDVKPRSIWQCLQDKVVWSSVHSGMQVLLRTPEGKVAHGNPLPDGYLPRDLVMAIKHEVKKLGVNSTVDKLAGILHWGKGSENRRKYGLLRSILPRIPDLFYDPRHMYLASSLKGTVVMPKTEEIKVGEFTAKLDNEYTSLCNISSSIVYFLTHSGYHYYPKTEAVNALATYGLPETDLLRLSRIFVPGNAIYLRKIGSDTQITDRGDVASAVVAAVRASPGGSVEFDSLLVSLTGSKKYRIEEIDSVRAELGTDCADMTTPGHSFFGPLCFFNPQIITLRSVAEDHLAIQPLEEKIPAVEDFVVKHSEVEDAGLEEADEAEPEPAGILPNWCVPGVLVQVGDNPHEYCVSRAAGSRVHLRQANGQDPEELDVAAEACMPRPLRNGDKVLVIQGPYTGRSAQLIGTTKTEGSLQLSKFEFKSVPLSIIVPISS